MARLTNRQPHLFISISARQSPVAAPRPGSSFDRTCRCKRSLAPPGTAPLCNAAPFDPGAHATRDPQAGPGCPETRGSDLPTWPPHPRFRTTGTTRKGDSAAWGPPSPGTGETGDQTGVAAKWPCPSFPTDEPYLSPRPDGRAWFPWMYGKCRANVAHVVCDLPVPFLDRRSSVEMIFRSRIREIS